MEFYNSWKSEILNYAKVTVSISYNHDRDLVFKKPRFSLSLKTGILEPKIPEYQFFTP